MSAALSGTILGTTLLPYPKVEYFTESQIQLGFDIVSELFYQIYNCDNGSSKETAASTSKPVFMPLEKFSEKLLALQAKILRCCTQTVVPNKEYAAQYKEIAELQSKMNALQIAVLHQEINDLCNAKRNADAATLLVTSPIFKSLTDNRLTTDLIQNYTNLSKLITKFQRFGCSQNDLALLADIINSPDEHRKYILQMLDAMIGFDSSEISKERRENIILIIKMQLLPVLLSAQSLNLPSINVDINVDETCEKIFEDLTNFIENFVTTFKTLQACTCCNSTFRAHIGSDNRNKLITLIKAAKKDEEKKKELGDLCLALFTTFRLCRNIDAKELAANQDFFRKHWIYGSMTIEESDFQSKALFPFLASFPFSSTYRKALTSMTDIAFFLRNHVDNPKPSTFDFRSYSVLGNVLHNQKVRTLWRTALAPAEYQYGDKFESLLIQ